MRSPKNTKANLESSNPKISSFKDKKVMVLGATGQVGRRVLSILSRYEFPVENLQTVSQDAVKLSYDLQNMIQTKTIDQINFDHFDFVFNCMPEAVIKQYIGDLWDSKCTIIDKSSAFRMGGDVPLVVPEINAHLIKDNRLIASPNCVTIPLCMVLHAVLGKISKVNHIAVSTYQSVSGAGNKAMSALLDETKRTFFEQKVIPEYFNKQIAFNVIPQIGDYDTEYSTEEENKIEQESKKILSSVIPEFSSLPLSIMTVRVPTLISHALVLHIGCEGFSIPNIEAALVAYPGIQYLEDGQYITPVEAAYEDQVYVSRLKRTSGGLAMWVVCDNLSKGSALNAVQIALEKV
jgi:aspartate-semialdehyde dehydrogenase